jgi:chromosome segregation ATPase
MEQKLKIATIALSVLLVICFISLIAVFGSKQALMQQNSSLKQQKTKLLQENQALAEKISSIKKEKRNIEAKFAEVKDDLERLSSEKAQIQHKYEVVSEERDNLVDKLKELQRKSTHISTTVSTLAKKKEMPSVTKDEYWAGILKERAALQLDVSGLKDDLIQMQKKFNTLAVEKGSLETDVKDLRRQREDLIRRVDYNERLANSLSLELVREKKDKRRLQEQLKSLSEEQRRLSNQLKTLSRQKNALQRRLENAQQEKDKLSQRISELDATLKDKLAELFDAKQKLEETNKALKGISKTTTKSTAATTAVTAQSSTPSLQPQQQPAAVNLPPIVVHSAAVQKSFVGPFLAKVLAVNEENNFVIIDSGQRQGLKAGDSLSVYRDKKKIATVEVIQVRKDVAACDIKQTVASIHVGDTVR